MREHYLVVFTICGILILGANTIEYSYAADQIIVQHSANPTDIDVFGAGNDSTTITLTAEGFGGSGTTINQVSKDLVIVLDESSSISDNGWKKSIEFSKMIVDSVDFGNTDSRVGIVAFSGEQDGRNLVGKSRIIVGLTDDSTKLHDKLDDAIQDGGETCMGCGIERAKGQFINNGNFHNKSVMIFLTDGGNNAPDNPNTIPQEFLVSKLDSLDNLKILRIAVGVGISGGVNFSHLELIAGDPSRVFTVNNFDELSSLTDPILGFPLPDAPKNVQIIERTNSLLTNYGNFSIPPTVMLDNPDGTITYKWKGLTNMVGDNDKFLEAGESVSVSYDVSSLVVGVVEVNPIESTTLYGVEFGLFQLRFVGFPLTTINVASQPPVITCPANATVEVPSDTSPSTTGSATAIDDTDPSPGISSSDATALAADGTGTITRTWTATDEEGNSSSCDQIVTVEDTMDPEITCPADVTLDAPADTSPSNTGTASATDNSLTPPAIASMDDGPLDPDGTGSINRTWTATDDTGNSSQCVQAIAVKDTTPPEFDPSDVTLEGNTIGGFLDTAYTLPTATDAVDDNVDVVCSPSPDAFYPLGETTVECTATDESGNSSEAAFMVTVEDTTPPEITAPDNLTVECNTVDGAINVELGSPAVSDNVDEPQDIVITNDAPDFYPVDVTTTVTWTATDQSGNSATAEQTVTVEDTTPPVITVPDGFMVIVNTDGGWSGDIGQATATDTCDANPEITNNAPPVFPLEIGLVSQDTTVTWTATDDAGNSNTATQVITVKPIPIEIDIKPGSDPNGVNPKGMGLVPYAILGTDDFDVTTVDVTTLGFGPDGAQPAHDLTHPGIYAGHLVDVNDDGLTDLVVHVVQKQAGLVKGDTEACVFGATLDGVPFLGCDSVKTAGK